MQINELISTIEEIHLFFIKQVEKQVDTAFTLRNWLIGFYLVEYEQAGADRAEYGATVLKNIAKKLAEKKIKGLSLTNLKLFRQFYDCYPQIVQTLSDQFKLPPTIVQKVTTNLGQIQLYAIHPILTFCSTN
jgi:hypothetical protein